VSLPWIGFTPEPQWRRVHLVPLTDPADKFRDVAANILLFLPFGYLVARRRPAASALGTACGFAAVLSVSAEATQLFSTERYPSATDVSAAIVGSLAGACVALARRRVRRGRARGGSPRAGRAA